MKSLRYTLIAEGSSDRAFIPILNWLLVNDLKIDYAIKSQWANFRKSYEPPKSLSDKINSALDLYPCDLLFIHRDADKELRENRVQEINKAIEQANINNSFPVVSVIPVRMMEAWLLFDLKAIRKAADNPNGKCQLQLPSLNKVEQLPDPKDALIKILKKASEYKGRRLKNFKGGERIHRLAKIIDDFSPLYQLDAFQALKQDLSETLENKGWL